MKPKSFKISNLMAQDSSECIILYKGGGDGVGTTSWPETPKTGCLTSRCICGVWLATSRTNNMRGSSNCRLGRGGGQSDKKKLWQCFVFLVLSLFYCSQMVNFEENYHFQGSRGGPTFSRGVGGGPTYSRGGGVQLLIPYRNPYNLWFSRGGVRTPVLPSGSALEEHFSYRAASQTNRQVWYSHLSLSN